MFEIFVCMFKEEWRMHSTLFGNLNFALFPILIFGMAFMGAFLIPFTARLMDVSMLVVTTHSMYCIMGFMVGSFGIMGKEMMNRRFGQGSLLIHSARSLPVSERRLFFNFVLKDTLYYFMLWIMPFCLGFTVAAPFAGINIYYPLLLFVTATLAFLLGMSTVFLLSSVYSRSRTALYGILVLIGVAFAALYIVSGDIVRVMRLFMLPSEIFLNFSYPLLLTAAAVILILFIPAVFLFSPETHAGEKRRSAALYPLYDCLSRLPYIRGRVAASPSAASEKGFVYAAAQKELTIISKDFIDLHRSGIGIGQTVFSFVLPVCLIWFVLSVLSDVLMPEQIYMVIAGVTGIIASTMYTWLTEFESFSAYLFLPVKVSSIIRAKIITFSVLHVLPVVFLIVTAVIGGVLSSAIFGIVMALSVSYYALSIMVRYAGLKPSLMLYSAAFFLRYSLLLMPVVIFLLGLSFIATEFSLAALILIIPSYFLLKGSFVKWDAEDLPNF
ncbi:MAG: hypothetical protein IK060_04770 [Methanomicrobium sp.]|nr:hypothetical protein [Methanomicrobium sp.]